ncbi:MAG TPA: hypothetical protein VJV75_12175 [Candidatus Polarisedimenticolia bacterium]|nr:hypothetical protein [Candidatus Polarisedimenticolia bacterium]
MLALATLAALTPLAAAPIEVVARGSDEFSVTVDGSAPPDARVYQSDARDLYLIDIPSQSKCLLVDTRSKKAVTVSRWDIKLGDNDTTLRVNDAGRGGPAYAVSLDKDTLVMRNDNSEVRLLKSSSGGFTPADPGTAVAKRPGGVTEPVDDDAARACLHLEARPEGRGVQGCTKFVYLSNACDTPVIANILRIEHLVNGTLPNNFSVAIPAGKEFPLGCSWYSGATAPTNYAVKGAGFARVGDGRGDKEHCDDKP